MFGLLMAIGFVFVVALACGIASAIHKRRSNANL